MKYITTIVIGLLTLNNTSLHAQNQEQPLIDSLLTELPAQQNDTNKVKILNALSFSSRLANADQGIKYGEQALELANTLTWQQGLACANNNLGLSYQVKSDYQKALGYFNEALKIDEEQDYRKGTASVLTSIGIVYRALGDYTKALEFYSRALSLYQMAGNKTNIAMVTANIGVVYQRLHDYGRALEYDLQALKMQEEADNKNDAAGIIVNIGIVYNEQGDFARALEYDFKALKTFEETGTASDMATVTGNIGCIYQKLHSYFLAAAWHLKELQIVEGTSMKGNEMKALENTAVDYIGIATYVDSITDAPQIPSIPEYPLPAGVQSLVPVGKTALLNKAVEYLNKVVTLNAATGSKHQLQNSYMQLSIAYTHLGVLKQRRRQEFNTII